MERKGKGGKVKTREGEISISLQSSIDPNYMQLEQEMETVIKVLQPGPLGIAEHKFSTEEILQANATVRRAVENWQRNAKLEQRRDILKEFIQK